MDILRVFGISAALLSIVAGIPYIIDIFRGRTKPERASYFIWSVLGIIFFTTALAEGATESLWFVGIDSIYSILVFGLAVKYGVGGFNRRDEIGLMVAGVGILLWVVTDIPLFALLLALLVDMSGMVLTMIKTWEQPFTETYISWLAFIPIGILTMLSVGELDYFLLTFPFYVVLCGLVMCGIMSYRRPLVKQAEQ